MSYSFGIAGCTNVTIIISASQEEIQETLRTINQKRATGKAGSFYEELRLTVGAKAKKRYAQDGAEGIVMYPKIVKH